MTPLVFNSQLPVPNSPSTRRTCRGRFALMASVLVLTGGLSGSAASGQTRDRVPETATASIARGWTALAAARYEDAVRAALAALKQDPRDHHAAGLLIAAEVGARRPSSALDGYERWLAARRQEDIFLLEEIARGVLQELAASPDTELQSEALLVLARNGVESARSALATSAKSVNALAARTRLGDPMATEELRQLASSSTVRDKTAVVKALREAGPANADAIAPLLADPSPMTRAAAAEALGELGSKSGIPALQKLLVDNDPFARSTAAVALAKLGDPSANDLVVSMMSNEAAEVRLFAAEAYKNRPAAEWVDAVRPSLTDKNGLNRLIAANLIAAVDPDAARAALVEAAADPNPVVRLEAAAIMVRRDLADIAQLRKLLKDAEGWVRLRGSEGLLRLAAKGTVQP
jgi:HEAT repeat protein